MRFDGRKGIFGRTLANGESAARRRFQAFGGQPVELRMGSSFGVFRMTWYLPASAHRAYPLRR
jgi:hypothetical protein